MAGSYRHVTDRKTGAFVGTQLLDHLGDAWEALEELYGMVWFLANGDAALVERSRQSYTAGISLSPGLEPRVQPAPSPLSAMFRADREWAREAVSHVRKLSGAHPEACDCGACAFVVSYDRNHEGGDR